MIDQWLTVDEGWGRRAVDFASLLEPGACRENLAMLKHLEVRDGDQLLDVACGSGLAVELARASGATVSGIDASARLVAIARDRVPDADVRRGGRLGAGRLGRPRPPTSTSCARRAATTARSCG